MNKSISQNFDNRLESYVSNNLWRWMTTRNFWCKFVNLLTRGIFPRLGMYLMVLFRFHLPTSTTNHTSKVKINTTKRLPSGLFLQDLPQELASCAIPFVALSHISHHVLYFLCSAFVDPHALHTGLKWPSTSKLAFCHHPNFAISHWTTSSKAILDLKHAFSQHEPGPTARSSANTC